MKKLIIFILLATVLLSGCSANNTSNQQTTSSEKNKQTIAYKSLESKPQTTTKASKNDKNSIPVAYTIKNFEIIGQFPELPTGCEITALTMVLNYYGLNPDKLELATEYLPKTEYSTYYKDGKLIGPDSDNYFLGDPTSVYGYICGTGAIVTAANSFISDKNAKYIAKDLTGCDFLELYKYVSQDKPIIVWTTIEMADRCETDDWYTENGKHLEWSQNDHCSVLIGYTEKAVKIADPILGDVEYSKTQFEKVLTSRGKKAVALFDKNTSTFSSSKTE